MDNAKCDINVLKIILLLIIIVLVCVVLFNMYVLDIGNIILPKKLYEQKAVIVKVDDECKCLDVILINDEGQVNEKNDLCEVSFGKNGNIGFKQGNEITIYFDGMILESFPAQISANKIKITKEVSEFVIPEQALWFFYNLPEKLSISVDEITRTNLSISIIDKNELPYKFPNGYTIYKDSKEITKISESSSESFCKQFMDYDNNSLHIKYNWSNLCGELGERKV